MNIVQQLEQFMLESNRIEGEDRLNPMDSDVAQIVYIDGFKHLEEITNIHGVLTYFKKVDWSGKWRNVDVTVGGYYPPKWYVVPELMANYWTRFPDMDSWTAHNEFEKIHPFQDFNGRMGRLIWLSKAVQEDYKFQRPFLHHYYYQTLRHVNE